MANFVKLDEQPVWTDVVNVKLKAPSGSTGAGDVSYKVLPGGYWEVCNVWGIKSNDGAANDRIEIGRVTDGDSSSFESIALILTGAVDHGTLLPAASGSFGQDGNGSLIQVPTAVLSGTEGALGLIPGKALAVRSISDGSGGDASATVHIQLRQSDAFTE